MSRISLTEQVPKSRTKSDVGEKRCLWRILENRDSATNISPIFTTHALLLWGAFLFFSNKKNDGCILPFSPSAAGAGQQSQSAGSQNQEDGRLILPQLDRGGRYYIVS